MRDTLGNKQWVKENEDKLKAMLPKTWTHMNNLNPLQLGWQLKLLGVDYRSTEELAKVLVYLEKIGIMIRQNRFQVRANPAKIFN